MQCNAMMSKIENRVKAHVREGVSERKTIERMSGYCSIGICVI